MVLDKEQISQVGSKAGLEFLKGPPLTAHFLPRPDHSLSKNVSPRKTFDTQTITLAHRDRVVYITYYNQKESQGENFYLNVLKTQSFKPVVSGLGTGLETKFPLSGLTR